MRSLNEFGTSFRIEIFGESHGPAVGCILDGLPSGFKPDLEAIRFELSRRAPRNTPESTSRKETDGFELVSGYYREALTGAPLCVLFPSVDADHSDYVSGAARPSHADLAASIKFGGANDPRGGGMFSGRLTLPLVFAGALVKQLLAQRSITVVSHIYNIGRIFDEPFDLCMPSSPQLDPMFPLVRTDIRPEIEAMLAEVRSRGDSVGGSVECAVLGVPAGVGEPFFDSAESMLSHLLFSIPGIHAVEFGGGFGLCEMLGSEANDPILPGGTTSTNRSGGINGGISNGMPIVFRAGFRPVPSIGIEQKSIDLASGLPVTLKLSGRHDASILPRGCAVVEAAAAIGIYELLRRC